MPGTIESVLPLLAIVLHFSLTREEPLNGRLADMECEELGDYSSECRDSLDAMSLLDSSPETIEAATAAMERWR